MPVFPALVILIVLGIEIFFLRFLTKKQIFYYLGVAILIAIQAYFVLSLHPYYLAHYNKIFPAAFAHHLGWGEGLNLAADYLNQKKDAEKTYVASWYQEEFGTFYLGHAFHLNARNQGRVRYVILYRNMFGRVPDHWANDVIDEYFKQRIPEKVIQINNLDYIWIYPKKIYERIAGEIYNEVKVGQTFVAKFDNLARIDVLFANYSSRPNNADLVFHLFEMPSRKELATIKINTKEIEDNAWHQFAFKPIDNSKDKKYLFYIDSKESRPGNAVTVRYQEPGEYSQGEMYLSRTGDLLDPKSKKANADLGFELYYLQDDKFYLEETLEIQNAQ